MKVKPYESGINKDVLKAVRTLLAGIPKDNVCIVRTIASFTSYGRKTLRASRTHCQLVFRRIEDGKSFGVNLILGDNQTSQQVVAVLKHFPWRDKKFRLVGVRYGKQRLVRPLLTFGQARELLDILREYCELGLKYEAWKKLRKRAAILSAEKQKLQLHLLHAKSKF